MEQSSSSSNAGLIAGVIAVAVLIFGGLTWAILSAPSGGSPVSGGKATFNDNASTPFVGPATAAVTVHIYGDFQCPACKAAEPALEAAMAQFKDRVKFVWKDFPLSTHRHAREAANAARCAEDQNKFWEMHNLLYVQQDSWVAQADPAASFTAYAGQLGLDVNAFNACYSSKHNDDKVAADISEGNGNGVNATPTFYVNDDQYVGMDPNQWSNILNAALAKASTASSSTNP
jgi:protein-disulfide isomerase